ncbi:MAG: hypothetical protein COB42_03740 [Sulfurimonas sp.]|nr:MAG: hypothetical protein COB42_03740 [Sulfurimonas sp.]
MRESESALEHANGDLNHASIAFEVSYTALQDVPSPQVGAMSDMLASRTLLESARNLIIHNKEWVSFAKNQVDIAKKQLKLDMIEYEKFKNLDLEEIKVMLKKIKREETKELDEVGRMTYKKQKGA